MDKFATTLLGALLVLGSLSAEDAMAAELTGRLGVGITILDSCHVNTTGDAAASVFTNPTGFNIRCTKGTSYIVKVTHSSVQDAQAGAISVTMVTIDY
jgi:uncharacterized protein (DUF2141 family)